MNIESRIAALAAPGATAAGLVVDGVEVVAAGKRSRVLVTVDLPPEQVGSAQLDAVAAASRAIGAALDEADVPSTPYLLEVSTPGTDRALTERSHFMRARTRLVDLTLKAGGNVHGRLADVVDDLLVLESADGKQEVPLADVSSGAIVVEMKRWDTAHADAEGRP